MAPTGIIINGIAVDLTSRVVKTSTVSASPAAGSETVVATTPAFDTSVPFMLGVIVLANLAYTIGTNGVSCTVKLRQTNVSGTTLFTTGAQTGGHNTATQLVADDVMAFDAAPAAGQTYCVTLTIGSGSAASTVSAVQLIAIAI